VYIRGGRHAAGIGYFEKAWLVTLKAGFPMPGCVHGRILA
jgi:hypothetical protein